MKSGGRSDQETEKKFHNQDIVQGRKEPQREEKKEDAPSKLETGAGRPREDVLRGRNRLNLHEGTKRRGKKARG